MSKRTHDQLETEMEAGPSTATSLTPSTNGTTTPDQADVGLLKIPQKRFYRQRAHANVFVDHELD
nr:hypothetical protein I302_08731 [Kwoniella bestiolae CBS 10118]OCF21951.1 hypothetical protein I302_08731 [Kwoniella bestiolae CBS 10118]